MAIENNIRNRVLNILKDRGWTHNLFANNLIRDYSRVARNRQEKEFLANHHFQLPAPIRITFCKKKRSEVGWGLQILGSLFNIMHEAKTKLMRRRPQALAEFLRLSIIIWLHNCIPRGLNMQVCVVHACRSQRGDFKSLLVISSVLQASSGLLIRPLIKRLAPGTRAPLLCGAH